MKKFVDICYIFVHGKNDSCSRHVQYICIGKTIKIYINYCASPTSSVFNNFPDMVLVEQPFVSLMILKDVQFTKV